MANSKKSLKNSPSLNRKIQAENRKIQAGKLIVPDVLSLQLNDFLAKQLSFNHPDYSHLKPTLRLALSGGLDSVVLLHLLAQTRKNLPFELHAMHVHHGLSPNADAWAAFCQAQCDQLGVPLQIVHVQVAKNPDYKNSEQGIESEARRLRYHALFHQGVETGHTLLHFVVTAHHQDDQAETLLLQLFRGAGVKGLSGMAAADTKRRLLRPLLDVPRQVILAYAMQHQLQWCEDESNDNTQYDRNFLRHALMPKLESRFKGVKAVLARTAGHMAEAADLLETLAELDGTPLLADDSLCLHGLAQLSLARIKNLLRWWFARNELAMPTAEHLHEIVEQLLYSKSDAAVNIKLQHLKFQNQYLRKYQQRAYLCIDRIVQPFDMVWNGESELALPDGGKLVFKQVTGRGLALEMGMQKLRICLRAGGERFKPDANRPTRTLKYLLQEVQMPPWQRERLPLVYWDDQLACVPGVGIACSLQATPDRLGLEIIWQE